MTSEVDQRRPATMRTGLTLLLLVAETLYVSALDPEYVSDYNVQGIEIENPLLSLMPPKTDHSELGLYF